MRVLVRIGGEDGNINVLEIVEAYYSYGIKGVDKEDTEEECFEAEGFVMISSLEDTYVLNIDYAISTIFMRTLFNEGILDLTKSYPIEFICMVNPTEEDLKEYF